MFEICPVCKGTGRVPAGFYSVGITYSSTSTLPYETCRSCGGKGYIYAIKDSEEHNYAALDANPCKGCNIGWGSNTTTGIQSCHDTCKAWQDYVQHHLEGDKTKQSTSNKTTYFRSCGGCSLTDGLIYTSNPPKVKCTILDTYRYTTDKCFLYNVNSSVENVYDKLIELLKELKEEKVQMTSDTANSTVKEIDKTNKSISISWGYARTESELPSISQLYSDYPDEGRLLLFLVGQDDNVPKKVYVFSRKSECYMHLCNEDEINWKMIYEKKI